MKSIYSTVSKKMAIDASKGKNVKDTDRSVIDRATDRF